MRIFIAGAAGAIGKRLVPLLASANHTVIGTTRTPAKFDLLRSLGAEPVALDGLDRDAVRKAVSAARPDVIIHEMTAIASTSNVKNFDRMFASTNRLRTEGTKYLLDAALGAGVRKFLAQSYAGWPNERRGSRIKTETDPLDSDPPKAISKTLDAIRVLERSVTSTSNIQGIVLRYGGFYGPGNSLGARGEFVELIRQRKFPLVGSGAGVWSFLHIDDAARATAFAIHRAPAGIYNIVDDEPAEVSVWLPYLAECLGAKPPRHVPAWIARFAIGDVGIMMMTTCRGSSNAKAKLAFGWQPRFSSWRQGFREGLGDPASR